VPTKAVVYSGLLVLACILVAATNVRVLGFEFLYLADDRPLPLPLTRHVDARESDVPAWAGACVCVLLGKSSPSFLCLPLLSLWPSRVPLSPSPPSSAPSGQSFQESKIQSTCANGCVCQFIVSERSRVECMRVSGEGACVDVCVCQCRGFVHACVDVCLSFSLATARSF